MKAYSIDPRDVDVEVDYPTYRVYFWERPTDERVPAELIGFRSEEYEIAEANDVRDVLAWAES